MESVGSVKASNDNDDNDDDDASRFAADRLVQAQAATSRSKDTQQPGRCDPGPAGPKTEWARSRRRQFMERSDASVSSVLAGPRVPSWSCDTSNPAGAAGTAYLIGAAVKDPIACAVGTAY